MKSKSSIIFISIIIVLLIIMLALLVNHLVCQRSEPARFMRSVDNWVVGLYNAVLEAVQSALAYLRYLYLEVTAIQTPEYPKEHMPLYIESRVLDYSFDKNTNSLIISSGTNSAFDEIYTHYSQMFAGSDQPEYFRQFKTGSKYTAYGMIGNFTFLLEAVPSDVGKYQYHINTQLHYTTDDELRMENFFRTHGDIKSFLYSNPYIYMYQKPGDTQNVYLQLRDYKSRLLLLDTHVELYIDDEFYASRYYGDTIRVPVSKLDRMCTVKMTAFDDTGCIRAVDIMHNTLFYDAEGQTDFYHLAQRYSDAQNLFVINTDSIENLYYLIYFTELQYLHFEGSESIENYDSLITLGSLTKLYLGSVNSEVIHRLDVLDNLDVLSISDCNTDIPLGEDFSGLHCKELIFDNCPNLTFDEYGLFSVHLERLSLSGNYSLNSIDFTCVYPNLHMIEISDCDSLDTLMNATNLPHLNMLSVNNCIKFDLSQPLSNMPLIHAQFSSCPSLSQFGGAAVQSIWANESLMFFKTADCGASEDAEYATRPWKGAN